MSYERKDSRQDWTDFSTSSDDSDAEEYRQRASQLGTSSRETRRASRQSATRRGSGTTARTTGLRALQASKARKVANRARSNTQRRADSNSSDNDSASGEDDTDDTDDGEDDLAGVVGALMTKKKRQRGQQRRHHHHHHHHHHHSSSTGGGYSTVRNPPEHAKSENSELDSDSDSDDGGSTSNVVERKIPIRPSRATNLRHWESKYSMSAAEEEEEAAAAAAEEEEEEAAAAAAEDGNASVSSETSNHQSIDSDDSSPTVRLYQTQTNSQTRPSSDSSDSDSEAGASSDDSDTRRRRLNSSRRRSRQHRNGNTTANTTANTRNQRQRRDSRRRHRQQRRRRSSANQGVSLLAEAMMATVPAIPVATAVIALPVPDHHPIAIHHRRLSSTNTGKFLEFIHRLQEDEWQSSFSPSLALRTILDEMHEYVCQALESLGDCGVTGKEQSALVQALQELRTQPTIWTTKVQHDVEDLLDALSLPRLSGGSSSSGSGSGGGGSGGGRTHGRTRTVEDILADHKVRGGGTASVRKRNNSLVRMQTRELVGDVPPQVGERITAQLTRLGWTEAYSGTVEGVPFQDGRQDTYAVRFDAVGGFRNDVLLDEMVILPAQRLMSRRASLRASLSMSGIGTDTGTVDSGTSGTSGSNGMGGEAQEEQEFGEVQMSLKDFHYRGWVYKQTKSKGWTLRWFVLTPNGTLISCKSEKLKHAKGSRQVRLIARNWSCTVKEGKSIKGHKNIMTILHRDPKHSKTRGFVLSTLSNTAKMDWMNAIKNYIPVTSK